MVGITSFPSSGTKWMAAVLKEVGIRSLHESNWKRDTQVHVAWWLAAKERGRYDTLIHQVRHPLDSCETQIQRHYHKPKALVTAIGTHIGHAVNVEDVGNYFSSVYVIWARWAEFNQSLNPVLTYRVEDARNPETMQQIMDAINKGLGKSFPIPTAFPDNRVNAEKLGNRRPRVTEDELKELFLKERGSLDWFYHFTDMMRKMGYDFSDPV